MAARFSRANARSNDRINNFKFDIKKDGVVSRDLGAGQDSVEIKHDTSVSQIRVTFTSSEVGNGNPLDSNTMANQDGGLAVRVQAEDASGEVTGAVSRFDDEGITFTTKGDATFEVRNLPDDVSRGNQFDEVILGTIGADTFNESGSSEVYYINAGMGNDTIVGGLGNDFLVGGGGNDVITGAQGDDGLLGGGGNDRAIFNISTDGSDRVDLGAGDDEVSITAPSGGQIRVTFTSGDVGNGVALDGNNAANEDGGLAVRLQLEGASDSLTGVVSRFDDEGISFTTVGDAKFDVRNLIDGAARGNQFDVVTLGTNGNDTFNESGESEAYYINAGAGNDTITGGLGADFLVGGDGNDLINGGAGNDSFIGGAGNDNFIFTGAPGNDRIIGFATGADKIDLRAYGITFANISTAPSGTNTIVSVDSNNDMVVDFQITLTNIGAPLASDYLF